MNDAALATALTGIRPELTRYLTRLLGHPDAADDVVQSTYVQAHQALDRAPHDTDGMRRWLFRIASNLALDEIRRRKRWGRNGVLELREMAENNQAFMERSAALIGTPEVAHLVREHVETCLGCVNRNLPAQQAAAVLLRELHGFSVEQAAEILAARPTQVKNWIQTGRRKMQDRYAETCALVTKGGMCHQCSELSAFFRVPGPASVGISAGSLNERFDVTRALNEAPLGEWHRALLHLPELTSQGPELTKATSAGSKTMASPRRPRT